MFTPFKAASLLAIAVAGAQAATNISFDGRTCECAHRDSLVHFSDICLSSILSSVVNKGLVAFGRIPSDAVDSYGETLGGLGSSIALDYVVKKFDGSFAGKIQVSSIESNVSRSSHILTNGSFSATSLDAFSKLNPDRGQ